MILARASDATLIEPRRLVRDHILMMQDKARLDEMQQTTTRLLPELQAKLAALQEDLVREREAVKEIEACDAGELEGLRESITEQKYVSAV